MDEKYIALFCEAAVRDVQVCLGDLDTPDLVLDDDSWVDMNGARVFIGVFDGTREKVLEEVSRAEHCPPQNIILIAI